MTIGMAPVTGIPLPFVSAGGSSLIMNLIAIGILQAIHARGRGPPQKSRDRLRRSCGPSDAGPTRRRIDGGGPPGMTKREVYELLMIEEADAWFEYLEATREKMPNRYDELEPWAWARLNQRLRPSGGGGPSCRRPEAA